MAQRGFLPDLFGVNNRLPLSYEARLAQMARRRKEITQANDLSRLSEGKMVSGHYVGPNAWTALAQAAGAFAGGLQHGQLDREENDLTKQRQEEFERTIAEVPTRRTIEGVGPPSPDGRTAPDGFTEPTPQDFIKWGGKLSQLGPLGQSVGQHAIERGVNGMLPKTAGLPDYEKHERTLPDGRKQLVYIDKKNPLAPPIPVGEPFEVKPTRPSALEDRTRFSAELIGLMNKPQRTPEEDERVAALKVALNTISAVPVDGGANAFDEAVIAAGPRNPPPGTLAPPAPPSAGPAAPQPPTNPLGRIDPAVQRERDLAAVKLKTEEGAPPADIALSQRYADKGAGVTPAAPAPSVPRTVDDYAPYRDDPRNAPYIPKTPGPGMTSLVAGTGAQQRLNTDVEKLAKVAQDEKIPVLEDAWETFEKVAARIRRSGAATAGKPPPPQGFVDTILGKLQVGQGYGGTLGINNILPNALTSDDARDLRIAVEKLKAFERNRLFGQTLTGNEKMSFEQMAGTLFGMGDQDFDFAMQNMRNGFEKGKAAAFAGYAPIVVDTWNKQRGRGGSGSVERKQPWFKDANF